MAIYCMICGAESSDAIGGCMVDEFHIPFNGIRAEKGKGIKRNHVCGKCFGGKAYKKYLADMLAESRRYIREELVRTGNDKLLAEKVKRYG